MYKISGSLAVKWLMHSEKPPLSLYFYFEPYYNECGFDKKLVLFNKGMLYVVKIF